DEEEARVVRLAAHGVVAGAEGAAEDDADLGDVHVADGVHHLGAGADDPLLLGILADHEAVDVVEEDQRDLVLAAVEDEAGGLLGALAVDDAAELDRVAGAAHVGLLVGDDADGEAAEAGEAADERRAVLLPVLLELAAVDEARQHVAHVVLADAVARDDAAQVG